MSSLYEMLYSQINKIPNQAISLPDLVNDSVNVFSITDDKLFSLHSDVSFQASTLVDSQSAFVSEDILGNTQVNIGNGNVIHSTTNTFGNTMFYSPFDGSIGMSQSQINGSFEFYSPTNEHLAHISVPNQLGEVNISLPDFASSSDLFNHTEYLTGIIGDPWTTTNDLLDYGDFFDLIGSWF